MQKTLIAIRHKQFFLFRISFIYRLGTWMTAMLYPFYSRRGWITRLTRAITGGHLLYQQKIWMQQWSSFHARDIPRDRITPGDSYSCSSL